MHNLPEALSFKRDAGLSLEGAPGRQIWAPSHSSKHGVHMVAVRALCLQLGLKVALVRLLIHFLQADDVSIVSQQLFQGQRSPPPGLHVPVLFR